MANRHCCRGHQLHRGRCRGSSAQVAAAVDVARKCRCRGSPLECSSREWSARQCPIPCRSRGDCRSGPKGGRAPWVGARGVRGPLNLLPLTAHPPPPAAGTAAAQVRLETATTASARTTCTRSFAKLAVSRRLKAIAHVGPNDRDHSCPVPSVSGRHSGVTGRAWQGASGTRWQRCSPGWRHHLSACVPSARNVCWQFRGSWELHATNNRGAYAGRFKVNAKEMAASHCVCWPEHRVSGRLCFTSNANADAPLPTDLAVADAQDLPAVASRIAGAAGHCVCWP